jgi:hypothetical protein
LQSNSRLYVGIHHLILMEFRTQLQTCRVYQSRNLGSTYVAEGF